MNIQIDASENYKKLPQHDIGTRISWRREGIALLMVGGLFSACTKENEENWDESALREAQNKIDILGCEAWELSEGNGELSETIKKLGTENTLLKMRLDALLGKKPKEASTPVRPVQPGDIWSDNPEIFQKAYEAEISPDGTFILDPKLGWELAPQEK